LFGPSTPYERCDILRQEALKKLFDVDWPVPGNVYTYLDESGNDVSDEFRKSPGFP
jgi:hypothetical protein